MKPLSRRQREVCTALMLGHTNKEAGRMLGISVRVVEAHLLAIRDKYDAHSKNDLLLKLWKEGEQS